MEKLKRALAYIIPFIGGIVLFFISPKEDEKSRFHAVQSVVIWLVLSILFTIFGIIPLLGWVICKLIELLGLIILLWAIYKIAKDEEPGLPLFGDITNIILEKI